MLEKYFISGLTYTWRAPPPVTTPIPQQDGSFVESGVIDHLGLRYTGMHSEILYGGLHTPRHYGLTEGTRVTDYQWLNYVHGRTAWIVSMGSDVLTGPMSGCWICSWTEAGIRRVGHIGTIESKGRHEPPNSTVKDRFRTTLRANVHSLHSLRGYNPFVAWDPNEMIKIVGAKWKLRNLHTNILSLVTRNNHFYSILMFYNDMTNEWICGGTKEVMGDRGDAVLNALAV